MDNNSVNIRIDYPQWIDEVINPEEPPPSDVQTETNPPNNTNNLLIFAGVGVLFWILTK